MTINKSQDQEYDNFLIDFRTQSFAHGHLYVALSRVKYYNKIMLMVQDSDTREQNPIVTNIIYPELL